MISFSEWVDQFLGDNYFLGALAFDVGDDVSFPNESKSFDEIIKYIKINWEPNDHYLKQFKEVFTLYEKEKVFAK